jgi:hypothetical protein
MRERTIEVVVLASETVRGTVAEEEDGSLGVTQQCGRRARVEGFSGCATQGGGCCSSIDVSPEGESAQLTGERVSCDHRCVIAHAILTLGANLPYSGGR